MAVDLIPTILYSGMMGVVVSALFRALTKPKLKQNAYFSALLVLLLIHILGELYIYSGIYQYAPSIAGFQLPLRMLLGPALFFYACEAMPVHKQIAKKHFIIALSGPVVIMLVMIPFIFSISPEQKLALANPQTRDPELWRIAVTTCLISASAFVLFTLTYLTAALKLHSKHKLVLMNKYSALEKRAMDWFRIILVLWGMVWILYTVNYVFTFIGIKQFSIGQLLPLFELFVLAAFTHFALEQLDYNESEQETIEISQQREAVISKDKMLEISKKLTFAMTNEYMYRDEDLSLNGLSKSIDVSENYISETLSQFMQTNFFLFVNGYRIEEAKSLLLSSEMLVSSIAYEVGFKSKSTFNSSFKKLVGETPTAFRKSNLAKI